jgi:hypothetical protein
MGRGKRAINHKASANAGEGPPSRNKTIPTADTHPLPEDWPSHATLFGKDDNEIEWDQKLAALAKSHAILFGKDDNEAKDIFSKEVEEIMKGRPKELVDYGPGLFEGLQRDTREETGYRLENFESMQFREGSAEAAYTVTSSDSHAPLTMNNPETIMARAIAIGKDSHAPLTTNKLDTPEKIRLNPQYDKTNEPRQRSEVGAPTPDGLPTINRGDRRFIWLTNIGVQSKHKDGHTLEPDDEVTTARAEMQMLRDKYGADNVTGGNVHPLTLGRQGEIGIYVAADAL